MKRLVGLILVVAMVAGFLALVAGCGTTPESKEGSGVVVPQGQVSVKKSGNSITITKNGTSKTWTAASASEKALGFPVPSSATLVKGTAIQVSTSSGSEKWSGASFYTNDTVESTIAYYKSQLSSMEGFSNTSTTIGGKPVGLFSTQSGNTVKSVIIKTSEPGEQGKTWIQIAVAAGAGS
jgi:hypothetical protein